jgi:NAD(P)H-hydrate repair Nnr-like enzyme with NAD(P)H-hydrate epimerase domain
MASKFPTNFSYLSATAAKEIDLRLMSAPISFKLDQLMELAGLAVAQAFHRAFLNGTSGVGEKKKKKKKC